MAVRLPPLFLAPRLNCTGATCSYSELTSTSIRSHSIAHGSKPQQLHNHHRPRMRIRLFAPLHPQPSRAAPKSSSSRPFHTSPPTHQQLPLPDHYATLSIPPTASPADVKKSFYALSKQHHPDRTRSLPAPEAEHHTRRYVAISEAYGVLHDGTKREKYDRERARHFPSPSSSSGYGHAGGTAASEAEKAQGMRGGRPASGLSRRRTAFRGPPPSFYKNGAWGGAAGRRQQASNDGTSSSFSSQQEAQQREQTQQQKYYDANANSGPDDKTWPFTTDPNDVPHFNRPGHYRTQNSIEAQLRQGRAKRRHVLHEERQKAIDSVTAGSVGTDPEEVGPGSVARNFAVVGGIMGVGIVGGWLLFGVGEGRGIGSREGAGAGNARVRRRVS